MALPLRCERYHRFKTRNILKPSKKGYFVSQNTNEVSEVGLHKRHHPWSVKSALNEYFQQRNTFCCNE